MTRSRIRSIALLIAVLILLPFVSVTARTADAKPKPAEALLTLPLLGTADGSGTFSGTLAITGVVNDGANLFVEGIVSGTFVTQEKMGTIVTNVTVRAPLTVTGDLPQVGPGRSGSQSSSFDFQRRIVLVQASTCGILHLAIGAINLNVLGVVVATSPITLDLSGDTAGPLGSLVCAVLNVLGTVASLVNALTSLLGGLGGVLGGGAVPTI